MTNRKLIWFFTALIVAALVGCSKKEEAPAPEQPAATTTTAPTPTAIDQSSVGTVSGKITFDGAKPKGKLIMMDQDPVCVQKHGGKPVMAEDGEVNDDGTLPNVFVYVKSGAEKLTFAPPADAVTLDQNGCMLQTPRDRDHGGPNVERGFQ